MALTAFSILRAVFRDEQSFVYRSEPAFLTELLLPIRIRHVCVAPRGAPWRIVEHAFETLGRAGWKAPMRLGSSPSAPPRYEIL